MSKSSLNLVTHSLTHPFSNPLLQFFVCVVLLQITRNIYFPNIKPWYLRASYRQDREFIAYQQILLTHWGWVTHICVGNLTIIGSDNGLSPSWRQAIIWTNAGILLIGLLGTNSEILFGIQTFSFKKMHSKMSSGKWRPFCLGLNVLRINTFNNSPLYSISQEICTRFLLCCALLWLYIDWFSHIHQAYFTGTVAI